MRESDFSRWAIKQYTCNGRHFLNRIVGRGVRLKAVRPDDVEEYLRTQRQRYRTQSDQNRRIPAGPQIVPGVQCAAVDVATERLHSASSLPPVRVMSINRGAMSDVFPVAFRNSANLSRSGAPAISSLEAAGAVVSRPDCQLGRLAFTGAT